MVSKTSFCNWCCCSLVKVRMLAMGLLSWAFILLLSKQFVKAGDFDCTEGVWTGLVGLVCAIAVGATIAAVVTDVRNKNSYKSLSLHNHKHCGSHDHCSCQCTSRCFLFGQ